MHAERTKHRIFNDRGLDLYSTATCRILEQYSTGIRQHPTRGGRPVSQRANMARIQVTPTATSPSPQVQALKARARKKPARAQQPEPVDIKECRWMPSGKSGRYEYLVGDEWLPRGKVPFPEVSLDRFRKKVPDWKIKSGKPEEEAGGQQEEEAGGQQEEDAVGQQEEEAGGQQEKEAEEEEPVEKRRLDKKKRKKKHSTRAGKRYSVETIRDVFEYTVKEMTKPTPQQVTEHVHKLASKMTDKEKLEFASSITSALLG